MPISEKPWPADAEQRIPSSALLAAVADGLGDGRVTVASLIDRLEGRGLGILLLIFSLPLCVPNIPGISTLFGLLLIAPAIQMLSGRRAMWMPGFVRDWTFDGKGLRSGLLICSKILRRIEFLARPRLERLTVWPVTAFAGLQTLIMALVLLLPMPGANVIPGVAVALTGLAILQKDGLFMLMSSVVAAGALLWVYLGGKYIVAFAIWAYEAVSHLIGGGGLSPPVTRRVSAIPAPWSPPCGSLRRRVSIPKTCRLPSAPD